MELKYDLVELMNERAEERQAIAKQTELFDAINANAAEMARRVSDLEEQEEEKDFHPHWWGYLMVGAAFVALMTAEGWLPFLVDKALKAMGIL